MVESCPGGWSLEKHGVVLKVIESVAWLKISNGENIFQVEHSEKKIEH